MPDEARWKRRCSAARRRFETLIGSKQPDVIVKQLPQLQDPAGQMAGQALSRSSASFNKALRREHYEQVGQWIAEAATIMIAVTSDPLNPAQPANGGSARVVACRRLGRPSDEPGMSVAQRSGVLRHSYSPALPPPGRPVWWIDPRHPLGSGFDGVEVLGAHEAAWPIMRHSGHVKPAPKTSLLRSSLALARAFERLNRRIAPAAPGPLHTDPVAAVGEVRDRLRPILSWSKGLSRLAFRLLAGFFILAILVYELYSKFSSQYPAFLLVYLGVLLAIGVVAGLGKRLRWQPDSEDYRAVSEMLRVQRVWWAAGLPDRVDREHLQGVDRDLALIREAAGTMLGWLWLRSSWQSDTPTDSEGRQLSRWNDARQGGATARRSHDLAKEQPRDWIGSQISYFYRNGEDREAGAHRADRLSWFLFITSGLLAVVLCCWLAFHEVEHVLDAAVMHLDLVSLPLGLALFLLLAVLRHRLALHHRGWRGFRLSLGFALVAAPSLMLAMPALGEVVALGLAEFFSLFGVDFRPIEGHDLTKYAAIVAVVLLNAVAGAWRFLAEKLGWEAEALAFRDMEAAFMTAEASLAQDWDPSGMPRNPARARAILRELGLLALKENEAWLKTRRERPLTPVSG